MEEAVRKWMINPKTPKTAPASTGRRGIMGDIEWGGGDHKQDVVYHMERGGEGFSSTRRSVNSLSA